MQFPRVYGSVSDVYRQNNSEPQVGGDASPTCIRERVRRLYMVNNYLNNSQPQVGEGCEFHAYTRARQTLIGKVII